MASASSLSSKSDLDHWRISATVYKDRVEEQRYITDTARGIRRQQYTKVWYDDEFLGRGGFGEVLLQKSETSDGRGDAETRAVKRIPVAGKGWSDRECEKELKALLEFSKPKFKEAAVFVEFLGWFKDGSNIFLAMEYMPLGDLEKSVMACSGKVPEPEARDIAEQILSALQFMHAESFAHRDLKPRNILVVHGPPTWWVKVADFGLSKRLTDTTAYQTVGGSRDYMAPEMLEANSKGEYTKAVDIWSVGCIVYRIVAGHPPFSFRTLGPYCNDKTLFPLDPLIDGGVGGWGCMFIQELLTANANDRPSASLALSRSWINSNSKAGARDGLKDLSRVPRPAAPVLESILSLITFDTATHEGLRSYSLPPSSQGAPFNDEASAPSSPSKNVAATSISSTISLPPIPSPPSADTAGLPSYRTRSQIPPTLASDYQSPLSPLSPEDHGLRARRPQLVNVEDSQRAEAKMAVFMLDYTNTLSIPTHRDERFSVIFSASFSPDGRTLASASIDRSFRLWDVKLNRAFVIRQVALQIDIRAPISGWRASVFAFLGSEVMFATAICDEIGVTQIVIFDTKTGKATNKLTVVEEVIHIAYYPHHSILISVGIHHSVKIWDLNRDIMVRAFESDRSHIPWINFSEEITFIDLRPSKTERGFWTLATRWHLSAIVIEERTIIVWDNVTGQHITKFTESRHRIRKLMFSHDATSLISLSEGDNFQIWDIATGYSRDIRDISGGVTWVGLSPDGKILASATVGSLTFWDFEYVKKKRCNRIKTYR